jgi:hypothetical protein
LIRKACDNCDRTIEVGEDLAGAKVRCSVCGDVNVMPGTAQPAERGGRSGSGAAVTPESMGLPPDSGPERPVMRVRPAMLRARPMLFFGLVALVLAGFGGVGWGLTGAGSGGKSVALATGGVAAAVGMGALGVWKLVTLSAALDITNKRSVHRVGLLSKATSEVIHDNIRNVQVTQTFWQRLWGVGKLGLSSSGQDGIEIEIADIPHPERVRRIIDAYRPLG